MSPTSGDMDRLLDLLVDRAGGEHLDPGEAQDLERLLALHPEVDKGSFERAAAAVHLALLEPALEPMPVGVRERVLERAQTHFARESAAPLRLLSKPWLGWIAAAAAVLLLWMQPGKGPGVGMPTADEVRRAPDLQVAAWSSTEDPGGAGVTGEVLWSDELQMGYMRFLELPENDPAKGQYQLWIFDAELPAEYPVDGGVFDSTGGDLLVPIDAKIAVADPGLFAITYERPGGVVVSTRERLLLTASPE
jgi:hypothetical protein